MLPGLHHTGGGRQLSSTEKTKKKKKQKNDWLDANVGSGERWWWSLDVHSMEDEEEEMPHIYLFR